MGWYTEDRFDEPRYDRDGFGDDRPSKAEAERDDRECRRSPAHNHDFKLPCGPENYGDEPF